MSTSLPIPRTRIEHAVEVDDSHVVSLVVVAAVVVDNDDDSVAVGDTVAVDSNFVA